MSTSGAGKFLRYLGAKKTAQDRRRLWAREDREFRDWERLSKGERKSRDRFARLIARGFDPVLAIRDALQLAAGFIPAYETLEAFEDFWSTDQLADIANRWLRSAYFRRFSKAEIHAAQVSMAAAAPTLAKTIVDIATDETAPKAARVKAATVGLSLVGLIAGSKVEEEVGDKKKSLGDKVRKTLRLVPKTGTDGAPA